MSERERRLVAENERLMAHLRGHSERDRLLRSRSVNLSRAVDAKKKITYSHMCRCGSTNAFDIDYGICHISGYRNCQSCRVVLDFSAAYTEGAQGRGRGIARVEVPEPEDPLGLDTEDKARPL